MMNTKLTKCALSTAIALTLIACSDDDGGSRTVVEKSDFISTGSISAFGSVFVNGVEFETDSSTFDIDDSGSGSEDDLAIGMVVTVNGSVNDDGITGNASSISFDEELQGPVSNITAVIDDPDQENRSFTILGTTVRINVIDTSFDVSGDLSGTAFDFDLIANENNVEVSGFFNTDGELIATRVELEATTFSTSNIIELKGTISDFSDISTPFTLTGLSGININAAAATLDDLPNGLANGIAVEVKGNCSDLSCSTLNATRVEGEDDFDDADKISVEGLVTDFVSSSDFKVNGISVDASTATLIPDTLVLADGVRVEVEGPISNNVIQAVSVELRGGSAKVHATVSSVDSATGNFVLTANGQPIAVTVTTATEMEEMVAVGNFVNVRGFENDSGGIVATSVEVNDIDDVTVQGKLQAFNADADVQVLGVSFTVNYSGGSGETEFEDAMDNGISQTQFIADAPVGTLVKIKDKHDENIIGVADEIEIETP